MKNFWALPAVVRVALVLAAQHHSFSVNDDLLAYPQYQIDWSEEFVSEALAESKLQYRQRRSHENIVPEDTGSHVERYKPPAEPRDKNEAGDEMYHEEMMLDGQRFLCAIPDIATINDESGSHNDTLSKAEQEKELARANERGWELVSGMQGSCVYYTSGWWSYSFCYNGGVRQFHQLPAARGMPTWPPTEDPSTHGFSLGKYTGSDAKDDGVSTRSAPTRKGELVVKGDTRYLVQKLEGGTQCDLTGDERKVEVQFHCDPSVGLDHISLIKELATCTYLMVIKTPRLCNDVAFLPPQKDQPNDIVCQPILQPHEVADYEKDLSFVKESLRVSKEILEEANTAGKAPEPLHIVGEVIVGAHMIVPKDFKLQKSSIVGGKETIVATVAKSDGEELSKAELNKLGLKGPKDMEKLREKLNKMAGAKGWTLEVVDTPRGLEYRGIIDGDPEEDSKSGDKKPGDSKQLSDGQKKPTDDSQKAPADKDDPDETQGSQEEFYKEEL
ncbi:hypothetical protein AMS68_003717 [Peltaster fructicola]|uniref:Endoplasmic reticulum lectin n=1 Tax=Peltaster fructicola TaxID=286661 RepID=A0A6H0XUS7_9PEZI|nr:hypothetical protein AMS68_003717 [Peltaster fructicola]